MQRKWQWLAAAVLAMAMAGCSSPDGGGSDPSDPVSAPVSGSQAPGDGSDGGSSSTDDSGDPGTEVPGDAPLGARAEFTLQSCASDESGSWSLVGTLTNGGEEEYVYTVIAFVAAEEGGTVAGQTSVTETVGPGQSVEVAVPDFYVDDTAGLHCVLNVTKALVE